ncbi:MAG: Protein Smg [Sodalis sp.]|nr:MAG: Protein Smg [Sodalis sp.]
MFDVLMYLFETYIHNAVDMRADQDKLTDDITRAGLHTMIFIMR